MSSVIRLLSNTSDAVCVIDAAHRIVLWNDSAELLFGYQSRDVLGRHCAQILRSFDRHGCAVCSSGCFASRLAATGQTVPTRDLWITAKSGSPVLASTTTIVFPKQWRHTALLAHLFRELPGAAGFAAGSGRSRATTPGEPPARPAPASPLTPREHEILSLLATGADTGNIASRLFISPVTVRNHVRRILGKIGAHSRLEAVSLALRTGLV